MTRLLDTSVIVKWIVAEEGSDAAALLIGTPLAAPDLAFYELGNTLWKKRRRNQISTEQALAGFAYARAQIDLISTSGLEQRALEIAFAIDHPVYDCAFIALAESIGVPLITADLALVQACKGTGFEGLALALA